MASRCAGLFPVTHIWNWPEPIEFILVHSTEELLGKYSLLALWEALTGRFGEHGDPHLCQ